MVDSSNADASPDSASHPGGAAQAGVQAGHVTVPESVQAVVIGAGQAGLSAAHELRRRGLVPGQDFIVLDANDGPGGAWRHRWDSLTLGAAHGIADLPGLKLEEAVPGGSNDPGRPASDVVSTYYGAYEEEFELPVIRPAKVVDVRNVEDCDKLDVGDDPEVTESAGVADGDTADGDLAVTVIIGDHCHQIVTKTVLSATGTWDSPFVPYVPGINKFTGRQLHTAQFTNAEEFAGKKTIVVGGGLSAVQFLLQLREVTDTVWATRRPPNFSHMKFNKTWGLEVERAVRARTSTGQRPASVVRTTGIPQTPEYLEGVNDGTLISRGMFDRIGEDGVFYEKTASADPNAAAEGLGPSTADSLAVPESWDPFPTGHFESADVIFWNTGFRHSLNHLSSLRLTERSAAAARKANEATKAARENGAENNDTVAPAESGVTMIDEVRIAGEPRVFLLGYGSTASTIGATRAGRKAGREAAKYLK